MHLVAASLTSALFYVSVKSLSIGPLPCTTPEGCSLEAPRCIKCPGAGENTPGYCSFLDPLWQTDLCFNPGYAQFCPNACADRHSISGGLTPAQGLRGPIDSGLQSGTTPGTAPQSAPVTAPEISPETGSDTTPGPTLETRPGNTKQSVPVIVPDTPPGTPEQQRIPSEQSDTTVPDQVRPEGFSPPNGGTSGQRRRPHSRLTPGSSGPTPESGGLIPGSGGPTPGSGGPSPGSGGPSPGSGQVISPEEGSTLEVWPTEKKGEDLQLPDPSATPSSGGSPSGQTLQIPTIPKADGPVPDPKFYNIDEPNSEIAPAAGQANPISTPNNLSDEPSRYTPPKLAFATFGDQEGDATQDMLAFPYFDTSTTS